MSFHCIYVTTIKLELSRRRGSMGLCFKDEEKAHLPDLVTQTIIHADAGDRT